MPPIVYAPFGASIVGAVDDSGRPPPRGTTLAVSLAAASVQTSVGADGTFGVELSPGLRVPGISYQPVEVSVPDDPDSPIGPGQAKRSVLVVNLALLLPAALVMVAAGLFGWLRLVRRTYGGNTVQGPSGSAAEEPAGSPTALAASVGDPVVAAYYQGLRLVSPYLRRHPTPASTLRELLGAVEWRSDDTERAFVDLTRLAERRLYQAGAARADDVEAAVALLGRLHPDG